MVPRAQVEGQGPVDWQGFDKGPWVGRGPLQRCNSVRSDYLLLRPTLCHLSLPPKMDVGH